MFFMDKVEDEMNTSSNDIEQLEREADLQELRKLVKEYPKEALASYFEYHAKASETPLDFVTTEIK